MDFIPLEYTNDGRIGRKAKGDEPRHWPDLDVFGNEYVHPANTLNLPNNPGLFIVIPIGFTGEKTVELRKKLQQAPAVKDPDFEAAIPITEEQAATMPDAEVQSFPAIDQEFGVKKGKR